MNESIAAKNNFLQARIFRLNKNSRLLSLNVLFGVLLLMYLVVMIIALPQNVFAENNDGLMVTNLDEVDHSKTASLTLKYELKEKGNEPLSQVPVKIYRVADMRDGFPLTPEFSQYASLVGWDEMVHYTQSLSHNEWDILASTLADYLEADGIEPTASSISNESGIAKFTDLELGLYLVVHDDVIKNTGSKNMKYSFTSALVSLPNTDATGNLNYSVEVYPKSKSSQITKSTDYKVVKHWNDNSSINKRPQEITVDILRDGTLFETVVLSDKNDWLYEWQDDDATHRWSAVERNLDSQYNVRVNKQNETIIITNTLSGDFPKKSIKPATGSSPKTGDLWWPIPLLLCLGLLTLSIGKLISVRRDKKVIKNKHAETKE